MKLNLIQRRRLLMLPALLIAALLGNLVVSTSRAAMTVPSPVAAAAMTDGSVIGWGWNQYGQVNIPAEAQSGVTAIAGGEGHSLALKSDGTVVGWGLNAFGEVNIPAGLSGVTAIAAGEGHSLALKADGTVVGWGNNVYGQVNIPAGLSGVIAIAAGGFHGLVLKPLPPNNPPVARCQNITVPIVAGCAVSISAAQINNGSSDPDAGDSISLSLNTYGPFGPGRYPVTLTATDSHDASTSCTAYVTVVDHTAPTITLYGANPMTVECPYGFVDPGAAASDNCTGSVAVTTSGSVNAGVPGRYTFTYMASDGVNTAMKTRTVYVVDTTAPALTLKTNATPFPNNHKYRSFTMADMVASVSDGCNTSLGIGSVVIEKVTSDEPDDAAGNSDGSTTNDIVIAADCRSVQLRAERDDKKNGRVYVITLRVKDASGNTTRAEFRVSVPLNQSGAPAVQDAAAQTKTGSCP